MLLSLLCLLPPAAGWTAQERLSAALPLYCHLLCLPLVLLHLLL